MNRAPEEHAPYWHERRKRMVRATNDRSTDDEELRLVFNLRYIKYLRGRTLPEALSLWEEHGGGGPLIPAGAWRFSGGLSKNWGI